MCHLTEILSTSIYKLKIKYQVFIGILTIIVTNLVLVTVIITLNVFLLSNSYYKDIINNLDNKDFEQLAYFGMASEYGNMHFSELVRGFISNLGFIKSNLKDEIGLLDSNFVDSVYPNFVLHIDEFEQFFKEGKEFYPLGCITYFSPSKSFADLKSDKIFQKELQYMKSISPSVMASYFVNIFNNQQKDFGNLKREFFFEKIIFVNYKLDLIFFYPCTLENYKLINTNINLLDLKDYVIKKNVEMIDTIEKLQYESDTVYNSKNFDNIIFQLPLFLENDIYSQFFKNNSVKLKILSSINLFKNPLEINKLNFLNKFEEGVFLLSTQSSADVIYDDLSSRVPATNILVADYKYPYDLLTDFQCARMNYKRNYSNNYKNNIDDKIDNNSTTTLDHLHDCFDDTPRDNDVTFINKLTRKTFDEFSDTDDFFLSTNLFYQNKILKISESTKKIMVEKEVNIFTDLFKSHNNAINSRIEINGEFYKVRKTYSPMTTIHFFKYQYPITSISANIIIKNEGVFTNNKKYVYYKSIKNFMISFLGSLIISYMILVFIVIHLLKVMNLIDKPLNLINDAVQSISEKDKFNDAKNSLEKYIYDTNNDEVIDEFVDLITIILDMIEGNTNLKQEMTHSNFIKLKMEEDKYNRESEIIKFNNLIVQENKILDQVEKKNYFNEILKISFDKEILLDEKVRNCALFKNIFVRHRRNIKRSRINKIKLNELNCNDDNWKISFNKFPFVKNVKNIIVKRSIITPTHEEEFSSEDDFEHDENIFEVEENLRIKVKKMVNVKDVFILGKLRRIENPFFLAFNNFKSNNEL